MTNATVNCVQLYDHDMNGNQTNTSIRLMFDASAAKNTSERAGVGTMKQLEMNESNKE